MAQLTRPAPRPPRLCTVFVREGSLEEMHICEGPGVSCAPVHLCRGCPRSGNKTNGNGSSPERQTGLPVHSEEVPDQLDHLGMESPLSQKHRLS